MTLSAKIVSVNVGRKRLATWQGRSFSTGIFKSPVEGPVRVEGVNVSGDDQADRQVHGGPTMAVYAFPSEHYASWQEALPNSDFTWGAFGENLTTAGLLETDVLIGDRFRCGSVELVVTQPRTPCFKLAMRLKDNAAIKRMVQTAQTGFYLTIAQEGEVTAGDAIERVSRPDHELTIDALVRLDSAKQPDREQLESALATPGLTDCWRSRLQARLERQ